MNKLALLFPGQGSQYVGMGKRSYESSEAAKEAFEEANDTLGMDIRRLCFEGSLEALKQTENTQPAILTACYADYLYYRQQGGIEPHYSAGHSLGEITALTCAGAISFRDALQIVRIRGELMAEAGREVPTLMSAVRGMKPEEVEDLCASVSTPREWVVVSNYNSPGQLVVAGHRNSVISVEEAAKQKNADVIRLEVSTAFHTPLMREAGERLFQVLKGFRYEEPAWPVLSNVTVRPYESKSKIPQLLTAQMTSPVRWTENMDYLQQQGVVMAVEIGPKAVLRNLVRPFYPEIHAFSFNKEEDQASIFRQLQLLPTVVTKCLAAAVSTKNQNWAQEEYQQGVIEPYEKIRKLHNKLKQSGKQPDVEQMRDSLDMLIRVFTTKKVPLEEQKRRIAIILKSTGTGGMFKDYLDPFHI
ncbi:ACP S-malonyltransferase [Paenibacillus sp. FSL H3-0333]|uniref:ACP S-malonyltransferase n=1 Tax=Paenibacillus sp. FSL H3-0333 TaxID=2921373 RepID=UPI0030FB2FE7